MLCLLEIHAIHTYKAPTVRSVYFKETVLFVQNYCIILCYFLVIL